jgi:thiaminase
VEISADVDDLTATIEGFGSTTPVTKEIFEELVEVWKRCVVMEKGFWDMIISLS